MSYSIDGDGRVTFRCRGCGRETIQRSLKALPKGWCISGILGELPDPETMPREYEAETGAEALRVAAGSLCDHFCSAKCGKKYLLRHEVVERVKRLGVVLVLWRGCTMVVDGSREPGDRLDRAAFVDDKGKKHVDDEGKERPGSPPPFELGEGKSPV